MSTNGGDKMRTKDYNAVLPENITKIINTKGLKQCAVAEQAGYSKQQLCAMLNGRRIIKPCDAITIANVLGVTMNELYADNSENEAESGKGA